MAAKTARFQVDSRLARLLSQARPSTEKAHTKLVDSACGVHAENAHLTLAAPMPAASAGISDDESGMRRTGAKSHCLAMARGRRQQRTERVASRFYGRGQVATGSFEPEWKLSEAWPV